MRTCCSNLLAKNRALRRLSLAALFLLTLSAAAQTLARPGWAGSGVAVEPWWLRAVFYRIDPANFQDSDGDGKGDLAGITQRLGYVQSLGVDAIILRLPPPNTAPESQAAFEALARAAAEHKLRFIVELTSPASGNNSVSEDAYLSAARFWLNQGAAGIDLDGTAFAVSGDEQAATLVRAIRTLLNGFPGGRILIAPAAPVGDTELARALAQSAQLIAARPLAAVTSAAALRAELVAALGDEPAIAEPSHTTNRRRTRTRTHEPTNFLWSASPLQLPDNATAAQKSLLRHTMAALLLASRAAVIVDYGEEIGMAADSTMQWTPKNVTPPPPAPIERRATAVPSVRPTPAKPKPQSNVYGPYVPYVPPAKAKPAGTPETDTPAKIDPDTLPGFTSGTLPGAVPPDAATLNVAVEESDPHSLLNFYRRLVRLHHGNPSLHNGAEGVLNYDDLNALVWVRRPPPGAATAATVVAICNLSPKPLDVSLRAEMNLRTGAFHTLAGDAKVSGDRISVAAGTVWLGEWQR